jgi:DNA-binding MarR family transcriptional regulator
MNSIDRRAAGLQDLVQEILKQFQSVNTAAANGPHVDLKIQEVRTIDFLGMEGARMMREVAGHLSVAVNSLTSIVDGLEQKGLVLRQRSEEDRRVIRVELTASGERVFRSSVEANLRLFRSMLQSLTEDEQEIFMVLFRKISRAGRTQLQAFAA